MQIRQLTIRNFRGVRTLDWKPTTPIVCLIGPGNSTKSTILDAIELVLSPRWYAGIDDSDFYQLDTNESIVISATIGQLPDELFKDSKFGLLARGWDAAKEVLHDEPSEADEHVLTIEFRVDATLQPEWFVVNGREPDGRPISLRDRQSLGLARIGPYVDKDLTWARGSVLTKLTEAGQDLPQLTLQAIRSALGGIDQDMGGLANTAVKLEESAADLGVHPQESLKAHLDIGRVDIGTGAVALFDGSVPYRRAGLGDRQLLTIAAHMRLMSQGAVLLVDEVEHALEPYRLRCLLRALQKLVEGDPHIGQVILTTHSPTVLEELRSTMLSVTRSQDGNTVVHPLGEDLQAFVRESAEAFLSRKVIMCEGKTEHGLCLALDEERNRPANCPTMAYYGAWPTVGGGDSAPKRALDLTQIGYKVCLFIDSDKLDKLSHCVGELEEKGVHVIRLPGKTCIEQLIMDEVPCATLDEIIGLAIRNHGHDSVHDAVNARLGSNTKCSGRCVQSWRDDGFDEQQIRSALGRAAAQKGWFKRIDLGCELGSVVLPVLEQIPGSDLAAVFADLEKWIYA